MGGNDGDVVHKCINSHLVDIQRIRPMVQFPGTLSKYAPGVPDSKPGSKENHYLARSYFQNSVHAERCRRSTRIDTIDLVRYRFDCNLAV